MTRSGGGGCAEPQEGGGGGRGRPHCGAGEAGCSSIGRAGDRGVNEALHILPEKIASSSVPDPARDARAARAPFAPSRGGFQLQVVW